MSGPIPPAVRSTTPEQLRHHAQTAGDRLPAALRQLLLDAAAELEGSEQAYAELVDQKQALQRTLAATQSNLRAALAHVATLQAHGPRERQATNR